MLIPWTVQVSAQDETTPGRIHAPATIKTYSVTVTRASGASSDADLSDLVLSAGAISPTFDPGTTSYTLNVPFTTTSTDVTPTASDVGATITVNGNTVASGGTFGPIALAVGPNVITTEVTAADTTTMKTYTVTVNRGGQVVVAGSTGADGSYTTLKNAFDALNANAAQAGNAITVSIIGDTTETATASLNQPATSSWTSLTITPSGARTVSGAIAAGNPLINLNGADDVTIDGLNSAGNSLTISNTTTSATAGTSTIRFIGGATNNAIQNCTILGSSSSTSGTTATANILFSTSTVAGGNSSNTISGNTVGPAGASLPTREIMSLGTTANPNATNTVSGNNFFNWTNNCMFISGTGVGNGWDVNTNSLYQTTARTTAMQGISIQGGSGHSIVSNSIGGTAPLAGGTNLATSNTFIGINLAVGTASATSVQGNVIKNIRSTVAPGSFTASNGINLTAGTANIGNITGNTVGSANVAERFEINGDSIGINVSSTTTVNLSNNTVNNFGTTPADPLTGEFYFGIIVGGTGGAHTVVNNTVANITNSSVPDGSFNTQTIGLIVQATGVQTIRGNNISGIHSISTTAPTANNNRVWGMIVSGAAAGTVVDSNFISDITGASAGVGARSDNINGLQTQSLANGTFTNNMISVEGGGSSDRAIFGILDLSAAPTVANYYFNSVNVFGTATGVNNTYAFNRNSTATVTLRDNIFANGRTGGTGFHVAMANTNPAATGWSATASDYNLLYNVDNSHLTQWLGSGAGSNLTLSGFQVASGGDAHSFVGNPLFVSDTDLHITCPSPARDTGIAFGGVTTDFDGDTRDAAPDRGADELLLTPPMPMSAASVKTHGATDFSINLPFTGPAGIECRSDVPGVYKVVVKFDPMSVITVGSAVVTAGTASGISFSGNGTDTITVDLTGVANEQYLTFKLKCVSDDLGNLGDVPVTMGVLIGDVNGDGMVVVNSTDVSMVKSQVGNPVGLGNFRTDVSANGAINSTDVSLVKSHSGTGLTP